MPAPRSPSKPFHRGSVAEYFRASMETLEPLDRKALAAADREMAALGFTVLGDLDCSAAPGMIIRGYGTPGGFSLGIHVQSETATPYSEFYSEFDDSSSLTTTSGPLSTDYTAHRIFRHLLPGSNVGALYAAHVEALRDFAAARRCTPRAWSAELRSAAEAIESFLVRASAPPPAT